MISFGYSFNHFFAQNQLTELAYLVQFENVCLCHVWDIWGPSPPLSYAVVRLLCTFLACIAYDARAAYEMKQEI